jgi:hypothetical protein
MANVCDNVWVKCGINGDYEELAVIQNATEKEITIKYIVSGIQDVADRESIRPMEGRVRRAKNNVTPKEIDSDDIMSNTKSAEGSNVAKVGRDTNIFRLSASIEESHGHPIYCAAFSPAVHKNDDDDDDGSESTLKYFATCAGQYVHIYEVDTAVSTVNKQKKSPMVRQVYCDVDDEEQFYTCAFGGKGITEGKTNANASQNKAICIGDKQCEQTKGTKGQRMNADRQGPPLLCVAGKSGIIKVIDTVQQELVMTLLGHGDLVNDLKCSPTNDWLLLSASKDHSIRLWNLQHGQMLAIYAGHDGHRGQVLSISWHRSGTKFASSAFDNTCKLWDVSDNPTSGESEKEGPIQAAIRRSFEMEPGDKFTTAIEQTPYFSTNSIHELPGCVGTKNSVSVSRGVLSQVSLLTPTCLRSLF